MSRSPKRRSWRVWLLGRPLPTADAPQQAIGKAVGLAVFASDALSSTAYATQEMLLVLVLAGTAALSLAVPIAVAVVALLILVAVSYLETNRAYPEGGGAYVVARDNLGVLPAQIAGAALLCDYILTVSVSVATGAAMLTSAYPAILGFKVQLAVALVVAVMLVNLRGVRESGVLFALPTFCFLGAMGLTLGAATFRGLTATLGPVVDPPPLQIPGELAPLGALLVLRAFASGASALTGVEAISNGVGAMREPRERNASQTLVSAVVVLALLFLAITYVSVLVGAVPSEQETVLSQIARTAFGGRGVLYLLTMAATTLILVMAASTAFANFPRLSARQAADGFLPRQLTYRGSRLVFSRGIVVLALASVSLLVAFQARVAGLVPLYAIAVFLSFTISQVGMAFRWYRRGRALEGAYLRMVLNGLGALLTAAVTLVFAVTELRSGAWVVLLALPLFVLGFLAVHKHYRETAETLSLQHYGPPARTARHRVILPVSTVHRGTLQALRYARTLSHDVTAVHVSLDAADAESLRKKWEIWGDGVRLVVLDSPYRLLLEPLLDYISGVADQRQPNETITIVVPQIVPRKRWHNLLHAQTAVFLRIALLFRPGIVITDVPYQLG